MNLKLQKIFKENKMLSFLAMYRPIKQIHIELTNGCNLRCPVCPTHVYMKREKGMMDFQDYKNIIDSFKWFSKPRIAFNFAGEPLLHPMASDFVAYANQNGHETFVSTNVTKLDRTLAIKLLGTGLSQIRLCLDGFSKSSHEAYRIGSDFDIVKRNIEVFMEEKKKMPENKTSVIIQTLVTSLSEGEKDDISAWAKKIGTDGVDFKGFSLGAQTPKEIKDELSYFLPKDSAPREMPVNLVCGLPTHAAVVFWNCDIGLCCMDYDGTVVVGNAKNKSFIREFYSTKCVTRRLLGVKKMYDICKKCDLC